MMLSLSGIALIGAALTAFLRPVSPALAIFVSLTCSLVLLYCVLDPLGETFTAMSDMMASAGLDGEIYFPVIKAVGIATVVRIVANLCRDAGQSALGAKLEFAGAIASIAVCVPLMEQVFQLMGLILQT
ncbi:MAG: SpoIIIAC/SpoIIIAD family protein [Eubacteriales bacterium]|nr:SpoIIIAC/SpoIIIAD family protein [Eubacteriales bacterium]